MARLTDTISGAIATFRTPGKQDIRSLKVHFSPVQEGTGDPSPENVRPISGWTGVEVYRGYEYLSNVQITTGKTLNSSGLEATESGMAVTDYIPVEVGHTYTLKFTSTTAGRTRRIFGYSASKEPTSQLASVSWATVGNTFSMNAEIPSDTSYIRACYYNGDIGKTLTEPSAVTTLPIDWTDSAGTVYGGYVDLVSGEVWETWRLITGNDLTTITAPTSTSSPWNHIFTIGLWNGTTGAWDKAKGISNIISDVAKTGNANTNQSVFGISNSAGMYLRDDSISTREEFLEKYGDKHIAYELATPTLLTTLTPTALRTLIGTNNIWSNANGNVDVEYDFAESREMMEARKRVATFKWKRSRLPSGYREVEYLESRSNPEGMQWPYINTGIGASVNKNTKADITFHIDCDEAFVFGARYSTSRLMFNINRPSSEGAIRVDIGTNNGGTSKVNYFNHSDTGAYTVHMEYFSASVKRHSDGSVINTSYTHSISTGVTAPNLFLFAVATGSSSMSCVINNGIIRIMSTKIWEGDPSVLVRDFVPCIRKSDNKAGMYDLVNNVFYLPTYGKFFTNLD